MGGRRRIRPDVDVARRSTSSRRSRACAGFDAIPPSLPCDARVARRGAARGARAAGARRAASGWASARRSPTRFAHPATSRRSARPPPAVILQQPAERARSRRCARASCRASSTRSRRARAATASATRASSPWAGLVCLRRLDSVARRAAHVRRAPRRANARAGLTSARSRSTSGTPRASPRASSSALLRRDAPSSSASTPSGPAPPAPARRRLRIEVDGASVGHARAAPPRRPRRASISAGERLRRRARPRARSLPSGTSRRASRPCPRFPASTRDLALVVADDGPRRRGRARRPRGRGRRSPRRSALFDRFAGGAVPAGHASLAFHVVYRAPTAR